MADHWSCSVVLAELHTLLPQLSGAPGEQILCPLDACQNFAWAAVPLGPHTQTTYGVAQRLTFFLQSLSGSK